MSDKTIVWSIRLYALIVVLYLVAMLAAITYGIWYDYPGRAGQQLLETFGLFGWVILCAMFLLIPATADYADARRRIDAQDEDEQAAIDAAIVAEEDRIGRLAHDGDTIEPIHDQPTDGAERTPPIPDSAEGHKAGASGSGEAALLRIAEHAENFDFAAVNEGEALLEVAALARRLATQTPEGSAE